MYIKSLPWCLNFDAGTLYLYSSLLSILLLAMCGVQHCTKRDVILLICLTIQPDRQTVRQTVMTVPLDAYRRQLTYDRSKGRLRVSREFVSRKSIILR